MGNGLTEIGALCRMNRLMASQLADADAAGLRRVMVGIVLGGLIYGFCFGVWRSPLQGLYSAVKMPLLFFSVVLASAVINTLIARVAGCSLRLGQVLVCMLTAFAVMAVVAGSLAPVVGLFVMCAPVPRSEPAVAAQAYRALLLLHVGVLALAGIIGNLRALRLLETMVGEKRRARRVGLVWLLTAGFVGCQLSWLFSPFLCKPTQEPHLLPREYFQENFYERVWHTLRALNNQSLEERSG